MQDAKELEAKVTERNIPAYEYRESGNYPTSSSSLSSSPISPSSQNVSITKHVLVAKATTATTSSKVDKPHPLFGGGQGGPMKKKVEEGNLSL